MEAGEPELLEEQEGANLDEADELLQQVEMNLNEEFEQVGEFNYVAGGDLGYGGDGLPDDEFNYSIDPNAEARELGEMEDGG